MKKLSVLVNNTIASQLIFTAIKNLNELVNHDVSPILFVENPTPILMATLFPVMQISEGWAGDGTYIATCPNTASKLESFPNSTKKYFYIWDLEWQRQTRQYWHTQYAEIIRHPEIILIARSKAHAANIENCFNKPVSHIISDFDYRELMKLC